MPRLPENKMSASNETPAPGPARGPTVNLNTTTTVPNAMASHAERPEKFYGLNFTRWQQKMFFYLTTLNLVRFLTETAPQIVEGHTNSQSMSVVEAWKHFEFLCRNYVLNGLDDTLYNVYCKVATTKELWESLERKYKTADAGTRKHVVAKFVDFKMIDSKYVMSQVQDLQIIIHDNLAEGMVLNEPFKLHQ